MDVLAAALAITMLMVCWVELVGILRLLVQDIPARAQQALLWSGWFAWKQMNVLLPVPAILPPLASIQLVLTSALRRWRM